MTNSLEDFPTAGQMTGREPLPASTRESFTFDDTAAAASSDLPIDRTPEQIETMYGWDGGRGEAEAGRPADTKPEAAAPSVEGVVEKLELDNALLSRGRDIGFVDEDFASLTDPAIAEHVITAAERLAARQGRAFRERQAAAQRLATQNQPPAFDESKLPNPGEDADDESISAIKSLRDMVKSNAAENQRLNATLQAVAQQREEEYRSTVSSFQQQHPELKDSNLRQRWIEDVQDMISTYQMKGMGPPPLSHVLGQSLSRVSGQASSALEEGKAIGRRELTEAINNRSRQATNRPGGRRAVPTEQDRRARVNSMWQTYLRG
jgi:hypothetical protein